MTAWIRSLTPEDHLAVLELHAELDRLHRDAVPEVFRAPEPPRSAEDLRKLHDGASAVCLVAELDGVVVGFANAFVSDTPQHFVFRARRAVVIDGLAVAPHARRRGIGAALVRALERWAASLHADALELNVWTFNDDALRFYRALGYDVTRQRLTRPCATPPEEDDRG